MYKFAPEQKKASKELIRQLHNKYYPNPTKPATEQHSSIRIGTIHSLNPTNQQKEVVMAKGAYTKVRETIASRIEQPNGQLVQICKKKLPRISLAVIRRYVARAAWELRKLKADA